MLSKINRMCGSFCRKLGLPKFVCLVVVALAALYLVKTYLLPMVEGFGTNNKKTLVFAYMDGCPHCDKAMPDWDKFASSCKVMNCKKIESKEDSEFMQKREVQGFPTYILLDSSGEKIKEYSGDRTTADLEKFANENK